MKKTMTKETARLELPSEEDFARWRRMSHLVGNALYSSDDLHNNQDALRVYELAMASEIFQNSLVYNIDPMTILDTISINIHGYLLHLREVTEQRELK